MSNGVFTQEVNTLEGFYSLEQEWRQLWSLGSSPSAFLTWEWIAGWWQHFGTQYTRQSAKGSPVVIAAYKGSGQDRKLIGLVPFIEVATRGSALGQRRLIQVGAVVNGCEPEEPVILCDSNDQNTTVQAVFAHLTTARRDGRWNHFTLKILVDDQVALSAQEFLSTRESLSGSPSTNKRPGYQALLAQSLTIPGPLTAPLPATWEDFRGRLGKLMRRNLSSYPRKLTRAGQPWQVRRLETPQTVKDAIPPLVALHHLRANSPRGCSHFDHIATAHHSAFLRQCLPQLAAKGMAFIAVLEVAGTPIASQIFLQSAGVLTFYNSGYDPAWYDFSPITLIAQEVIQQALRQGMSKVNFLYDDAPWKSRWGAQPEGIIQHLVGFSPHPIALTYALARRLYRGWHSASALENSQLNH